MVGEYRPIVDKGMNPVAMAILNYQPSYGFKPTTHIVSSHIYT